MTAYISIMFFFFQAEDGIRDWSVTGVQTCALPIWRLFRSLIRVSGVGPKIALALLSGISVSAFIQCVRNEDIAALTRVPGVGRKTAERLIVEMRDRLAAPHPTHETPATTGAASAEDEAYGALVALGYRPAEATRLLK